MPSTLAERVRAIWLDGGSGTNNAARAALLPSGHAFFVTAHNGNKKARNYGTPRRGALWRCCNGGLAVTLKHGSKKCKDPHCKFVDLSYDCWWVHASTLRAGWRFNLGVQQVQALPPQCGGVGLLQGL